MRRRILHFCCKGEAGGYGEAMVVNHGKPFRTARLEVSDGHRGKATNISVFKIMERDQFPPWAMVASSCFLPSSEDNLLPLDVCPTGGSIRFVVKFEKSATWKAKLYERSPADQKYVTMRTLRSVL